MGDIVPYLYATQDFSALTAREETIGELKTVVRHLFFVLETTLDKYSNGPSLWS